MDPLEEKKDEKAEEKTEEKLEEMAEEKPEEIVEEKPEAAVEEKAEEIPEEKPEEIAEEEPEEEPEEMAGEKPEEKPEEIAEEETEEEPEEMAEEKPEEMVEEKPEEIPEEKPEEISEEKPEEIAEEEPEEEPEEMAEEKPEEIVEEKPEAAVEEKPEEISEEKPEEEPEEMAGEKPEEMVEEKPEAIAEEISREKPEEIIEFKPEVKIEEIPEDTPQEKPDVKPQVKAEPEEKPQVTLLQSTQATNATTTFFNRRSGERGSIDKPQEKPKNKIQKKPLKTSSTDASRPVWERGIRWFVVALALVVVVILPIAIVKKKNRGTGAPSSVPSSMPSGVPSASPSATWKPSASPTTLHPSSSPTRSPTMQPTDNPTREFFATNPVPNNPPRGYFNYNVNDRTYGPTRWNRVNTNDHPLREFGKDGWGPWKGHLDNPTLNQCGSAARRQSPKNLYSTIPCEAGHEIRTWCGKYGLNDDEIEAKIWPHKLSFKFNRRRCLELDNPECENNNPPIADYPKYSSSVTSYSDAITYDLKVPGEHTIEGESFDGEIQILHMHPIDRRVSSIGIPLRVRENDGFNLPFQLVLNRFQAEYNKNAQSCRRKQRNLREGRSLDLSDFEETPKTRQQFFPGGKFDPYTDELMPTMFFYRYDGSITEPPCKDITWWVMSEPAIIAPEQLEQLKTILFTHVDRNCNPTSVHNRQESVARPIYPLGNDRDIQRCTEGSFRSDFDKGRGEGKKCRA